MNLRCSLAFCISLGLLAPEAPAQNTPAPPPQGTRRDPGLFRGEKPKKGEEENLRDLTGTVRDDREELVEGAVVQLKDAKTLRVRSFITKPDGKYGFFGLSSNTDYEIRAASGNKESEKKTLSVYDGRKQAVINLKLEPRNKPKQDP